MSPTPVANAGESAKIKADVFAAGAVLWRDFTGQLEVLLIHRPKHKDWSFPKGKVDKGETLPEAAVREVREETGYIIHLGLPLPDARYTVGKKLTKHVKYWSAEVTTTQKPAADNPKEVDEGRWLPIDQAIKKVSRHSDREQLEKLKLAYSTGSLRAWQFIIVRHAKAFPRSKWHETEALRPLLAIGTRQSMALTGLLGSWNIPKLLSSPWKRCTATLKPFSAGRGLKISTNRWLSEKANTQNPNKTVKVLKKVMARGQTTAICSHRPMLPTFLDVVSEYCVPGLAEKLPQKDPYLSPGEILVAYVRPGSIPKIVDFERFRPIDS